MTVLRGERDVSVPVRVRQVPRGHPYVDRILPDPDPASASQVVAPADPLVPGAPPGQWWPHPALDPAWVHQHGAEIDVVHLHFGYEHLTPGRLQEWLGSLRDAGVPLVTTVHDLDNPHVADPAAFDALLDVLLPAADALVTLTPGAAEEVAGRWGRRPAVVPHPHLVPADRMARPRPSRSRRTPFTVGLHLKSLRPNVSARPLLDVLVAAVHDGADPGVVRVHLHEEVLDPAHPRHDAALLQLLTAGASTGRVDLRCHPPLGDEDLWDDLQATDLAVLPYRGGTHSGWVEMCYDLGTPVLVPEGVGHIAGQHPNPHFRWDDLETTVTAAVREARAAGPVRYDPGERAAARVAERAQVVRAHVRLYRELAAGTGQGQEAPR